MSELCLWYLTSLSCSHSACPGFPSLPGCLKAFPCSSSFPGFVICFPPPPHPPWWLHPQHTCQHLQLSHQPLVTAVSSMIRLLQMQDAESGINHEEVALAVLVGLVAAASGHQDLLILQSPDHAGAARAAARQTDLVILRDRKPDRCWGRGRGHTSETVELK